MYALKVYQEYIAVSALLIMVFAKSCFPFICCKFISGAIMTLLKLHNIYLGRSDPTFTNMCM